MSENGRWSQGDSLETSQNHTTISLKTQIVGPKDISECGRNS